MLDNSVNQRYQVPLQAMRPEQIREAINASQQQAAMQGVDPERIKQRVDENYTVNRLKQMEQNDMIKQYALAVPIWYALCKPMDFFAKACRGGYKDTIQYKMGNFGDEIVNTVNNTSVGKSGFAKKLNSGLKNFSKWFKTNVVQKSAVLRAFSNTPTVPHHDMVKGQANGMTGALLFDYPQVAEHFVKPLKYVEDLDAYGADKTFINKIKNEMANAATANSRAAILERAQFELLTPNKSPVEIKKFMSLDAPNRAGILKDLKAKAFGFKDSKHMEMIIKDIHNHVDNVIKACQKANKNVFSKIWYHDNSLKGKVQGHFFGRKVYASEFANKIIGSLGSKNPFHSTWLGKMLPKVSNMFLEGSTNRVAGGKLVAAMQAYFLAECLIKTAQAKGADEKIKTFTERFVELVGFFIATPIAIQLMHKFGGVQYAGMSEKFVQNALKGLKRNKFKTDAEFNAAKKLIEDFRNLCKGGKKPHEAYREVLKIFSEKSFTASIKEAEHAGGKKALKYILKGDNKNIFTKIIKKAARVVTVGLEQIAPLHKKGIDMKQGGTKKFLTVLKDFFKHPKYWFKQGAGYPMRFLLVMMSLMPFINNLGVKANHLLFGRPKHSVLDKEEETQEKPMQGQIPSQFAPQIPRQPLPTGPVINSGESNLLNKYKKPQTQQNTPVLNPQYQQQVQYNQPIAQQQYVQPQQIPQQTIYQPQQAQSNLINQYKDNPAPKEEVKESVKEEVKHQEPVRTYIPSPVGVKVNNAQEDPTAANQALMRAEAAEKKAMEILGMR